MKSQTKLVIDRRQHQIVRMALLFMEANLSFADCFDEVFGKVVYPHGPAVGVLASDVYQLEGEDLPKPTRAEVKTIVRKLGKVKGARA